VTVVLESLTQTHVRRRPPEHLLWQVLAPRLQPR
jgi:hypothetical protein